VFANLTIPSHDNIYVLLVLFIWRTLIIPNKNEERHIEYGFEKRSLEAALLIITPCGGL
jgi:hypothetical protein